VGGGGLNNEMHYAPDAAAIDANNLIRENDDLNRKIDDLNRKIDDINRKFETGRAFEQRMQAYLMNDIIHQRGV